MDVTSLLSLLLKPEVLAASAVGYGVWTVLQGVYNLHLHPLSKFPGPKWAAFSVWWKINLEIFQGKSLVVELFKLHEVYGENNSTSSSPTLKRARFRRRRSHRSK